MLTDRLFDAVKAKRNPSILGLDTRFEYLPDALRAQFDPDMPMQSAARLIGLFNRELMDKVADLIPCVKLQSAYYEMYGIDGIQLLRDLVIEARNRGFIVIVDAKRNDIGETARAYSSAYLGRTGFDGKAQTAAFDADYLTVTPYLGEDGIKPFVEDCEAFDKGIFVLVKTSNPSSGQLQDLIVDKKPIFRHVMEMVDGFTGVQKGTYGYKNLGAVVGATYPKDGEALREAFPSIPFLVPGYGAQGARGEDLALCFDQDGFGAIVNASRSLLCAHQKGSLHYADATRQAALAMQTDLLGALHAAGRLGF
jgi:orotidine-5'-phosphate decarboxylase